MADEPTIEFRTDEWSLQMTSPSSCRFFVRLLSRPEDQHEMIFTDFILEPTDDQLAMAALRKLKSYHRGPLPGMQIQFLDVYASYRENGDKAELTRRHDQIVKVIREYLAEVGVTVQNAYLDQRSGKFDTIIVT